MHPSSEANRVQKASFEQCGENDDNRRRISSPWILTGGDGNVRSSNPRKCSFQSKRGSWRRFPRDIINATRKKRSLCTWLLSDCQFLSHSYLLFASPRNFSRLSPCWRPWKCMFQEVKEETWPGRYHNAKVHHETWKRRRFPVQRILLNTILAGAADTGGGQRSEHGIDGVISIGFLFLI